MTLSDFQGHSPISSPFKWDLLYGCAAVDKISTDMGRRGVPLRGRASCSIKITAIISFGTKVNVDKILGLQVACKVLK